MVSAPFITGALVGTLTDKIAGDRLNEANLVAREAENRAKDEKFQTGLNLVGTSGSDFSTRNFNERGGIDFNQPGGPTAAKVRELAVVGDYGKQQAINEAISNFKPTIPNLAAAQGMVDRDNALTQRTVDRMYDQAVLKRGQTPLGATSSNYNANLMDAIGRVSDKTKFNREQQAASLQQASLNQDLKNLIALRQAHTLDAPAPQFTDPNPGATAAQVATQMPTRTYDANLSEVMPYASGSKLIQTLMQQFALEDADRKRGDLIRQLGDAGAFKGTTIPTIPVG